jgi:hypothetical protein
VLLGILTFVASGAFAQEDRLGKPTFIHTKHLLPAPWHTGEIVAQADYAGRYGTARLRSLTITAGKKSISVPRRILSFFPAPRVGSLELYYGPPPDHELIKHRYLIVMFRYFSPSYEGISLPPFRPTAWILIERGRIKELTKIEDASDTVTTYTSFDPQTLKETGKAAVTLH